MRRLITFFMGQNARTWLGHAVQGVLLTLPFALLGLPMYGYTFTVGAFFHREMDNAVMPVVREELTLRESLRKVREDGAMDLIAPHMASILTIMAVEGLRAL